MPFLMIETEKRTETSVQSGKEVRTVVAKGNRNSRKRDVALWTVQGLLAALFLFAGVAKLVMPVEEMVEQSGLPAWFIIFIGVCETLGALGLVLPGLLRIRRELTPLAAAGLVIIMVGATVMTAANGDVAPAAFPFVVGVLAAVVVRGRWSALRPTPARPTSARTIGFVSSRPRTAA